MTKEQLKALLDAKKITQEVYEELCKTIDAGKQVSKEDLEQIVAKVSQALDEKQALAQKTIEVNEKEQFAKLKAELLNDKIIGDTLTDDEIKEIWLENKKDTKQTVIAVINKWAEIELKKSNSLGKDTKQFQKDEDLRKRILKLQAKVMDALGIKEITLDHLPSERILVDILLNDKTYTFYEGKMDKFMEPFKFVEIGSGINRTKQLETFVEEDDGALIPTATQVANSKAANFSYNVSFDLTDTKYKSYISATDGDYVKYFKSTADLVGFIQNTVGKCKRAIKLFMYKLMVIAYNDVFKMLYDKGISTAETPTNYRESTKENMLDALGEYKELKEQITKQYQSTIFCIEDSNMPYAASTSDFIYVTSLKASTNIDKYVGTALTGESSKNLVGNLDYIPDTYYDPLYRQLAGLNIFTDSSSTIHNNMIMAIEKNAFVPMYNLSVDWSANFPFGLTQVIGAHFRGNIEIDKTAKCFLFEADALLSDFSVPVSTEEASYVAPLTEKAPKQRKRK